jgi:hypothetical protein
MSGVLLRPSVRTSYVIIMVATFISLVRLPNDTSATISPLQTFLIPCAAFRASSLLEAREQTTSITTIGYVQP